MPRTTVEGTPPILPRWPCATPRRRRRGGHADRLRRGRRSGGASRPRPRHGHAPCQLGVQGRPPLDEGAVAPVAPGDGGAFLVHLRHGGNVPPAGGGGSLG